MYNLHAAYDSIYAKINTKNTCVFLYIILCLQKIYPKPLYIYM